MSHRIFIWCFCASPALLASLLIWSYVSIGVAAIFFFMACFGSGYIARWLDEPAKHSIRRSFFP